MSHFAETLATVGLIAIVAVIAVIDFRSHLIPNWANALLAAGGIILLLVTSKQLPWIQVIFAFSVFALFWAVRTGYEYFRGETGLGFGDVKMAGASALWFSPWNLPLYMLISCVAALGFILITGAISGGVDRNRRVPFGPFLGAGLVATFLLEKSGITTFIPEMAR